MKKLDHQHCLNTWVSYPHTGSNVRAIYSSVDWVGAKIGNYYDKLKNLLLYTNKLDDRTFSLHSNIPANKKNHLFISFFSVLWMKIDFTFKLKMGIEMLQLKHWLRKLNQPKTWMLKITSNWQTAVKGLSGRKTHFS